MYWTASTGTHSVSGDLSAAWAAQGEGSSALGFPVDEAVCGLTDGGCRQAFQYGVLYWSSATGGHAVYGAIAGAWTASGAERSSLGYPAADMACTGSGCAQRFQNGGIGWTATNGIHTADGGLGAFWIQQGTGTGPLGYPTGNAVCGLVSSGCRQSFQNGTVYWSPATGHTPSTAASPPSGPATAPSAVRSATRQRR